MRLYLILFCAMMGLLGCDSNLKVTVSGSSGANPLNTDPPNTDTDTDTDPVDADPLDNAIPHEGRPILRVV